MPDWSDWIQQQLTGLNLSAAREAEIIEELSQHAEDRYRELLSAGAEHEEARRKVVEELSGRQVLLRELRSVERLNVPGPIVPGAGSSGSILDGLLQDVRFGLRVLRKSPGFTAIAMLTLAVGTGANTAIFSVVNGVLLRPLPYPDPARLVMIYESTREFNQSSVAYPNYMDWRREARLFANMGAIRNDDFVFTGAGEPEQLSGVYVTASLLPTLGVEPIVGRNFLPQEDREGAGCTAMVSYGFWSRRFGGDQGIVGKTLTLNAMDCVVVGVLPRGFRLREGAEVWVPIEQWRSVELRTRESHPGMQVIGRLRGDATLKAAQEEMASLAGALAKQFPHTNAGRSTTLVRMKDDLTGYIRPTLLLLAGAVGFVLLIACANVANLLLARATARKREFAIRAALGAERGRLVRQLLIESVLLSLGAAATGLILAYWGTRLILAAAPTALPQSADISLDPFVLAFTFAVALGAGLLFGLVPAFHSASTRPQESLKEGTRGAGGGSRRAEGIFAAVEIGLAVILLSGAGLMVQSLWRLWQVHPGFNTRDVLTAKIAVAPQAMRSPHAIRLAYTQMLERVAAIPGVESAAITAVVPLSENDSEIPYWTGAGAQPPNDQLASAMFYLVTPDYARVMQIPVLRGRFLTRHDTLASQNVVVIDDVLAKRVFGNQDPIGKQMSMIVIGTAQVVGVVGHVKHWGLDSDDTAKVRDQIYFPFLQVPDKFMSEGAAGLTLLARTKAEPLSLVPAVRAQVAGPSRNQPVYAVRTLEQIITGSLAERRFTMMLLIAFASAALLLAAVGIYGVMSYGVARRTHEMGIRATLGASRGQIVSLVLREGMTLAAAGTAGGLLAAVLLTRLMTNLLYGVEPADPATLAAVALLLGGIALFACYIPARRATAVDPAAALRCE